MLRILKILIVLAALGLIALTGYAYLGDLRPDRQDVTLPVTLDVQ